VKKLADSVASENIFLPAYMPFPLIFCQSSELRPTTFLGRSMPCYCPFDRFLMDVRFWWLFKSETFLRGKTAALPMHAGAHGHYVNVSIVALTFTASWYLSL